MNLKQLAEKVGKLPKNMKFLPTRVFMKSSKDLPESELKKIINNLEVENFETQLMIGKLCDGYNAIRDILLEAEVE